MKRRLRKTNKQGAFRFPTNLLVVAIISFVLASLITVSYLWFPWSLIDALAKNLSLSLRSAFLTPIMFWTSFFGTYGVILGWLLLILWLAKKRKWELVIIVFVLSLGGHGIGSLLKLLIARERPFDYALVSELTYSFPSLHTFNLTIYLLTLTYLSYWSWRKLWVSLCIFTLSIFLIIMVGISRVYLGVHYFSDVAAGFMFGVAYLALVLLGMRIKARHPSRSKKK